jgi:hypothetical protein
MQVPEEHDLVRLEFDPGYDIELDPEFPSSGSWPHPVYAFDRDGRRVEEFLSRWGAPRVILVHPHGAASWVGLWPHGGLEGVSGAFAMPDPSQLCVVEGGTAYVVDVLKPELDATVASPWAQQISASDDPRLLLVSTLVDITAVGVDGIVWESPRLAIDDLRIVRVEGGRIMATGTCEPGSSIESFAIDVRTGLPT